jgi:hypothetical protein
VSEPPPVRVVACLDRPPRLMEEVLRRAADQAREAGLPLHVIALAPAVDPTCGCKFRGESGVLEDDIAERVSAQLAEAVAALPEGTTSELVRGHGLAALSAQARAGDLLVTRPPRGVRARLDSVLGRV